MGFDDPIQDPCVRELLEGIKRDQVEAGWAEVQAPTLSVDQVVVLLRAMGTSIHSLRDKAYLLAGLLAALRQSELTRLRLDQLSFLDQGAVIRMGPPPSQDQPAQRAAPAQAPAQRTIGLLSRCCTAGLAGTKRVSSKVPSSGVSIATARSTRPLPARLFHHRGPRAADLRPHHRASVPSPGSAHPRYL